MAASDEPCCHPMFWLYLLICVALVSFAGIMSGLTLGLMSLSQVDLEVIARAGQPHDQKNAAKILPIVKNQHLLLCTLLIGNSLAMEALPIFLDALVPAWGAIVISVTLILIFGEIIPQAVCSQYGLSVGAKMAVLVRLLVLVFFPISYPISKLLDWLLGKGHFVLLRRAELKTFVDMHGNEAGKGGELTHDETTIITGALELTQKSAKDAMTLISDVFSLDINSKFNRETMELILTEGHSRVPIYSGQRTDIIGLVLVKNLIMHRHEDETPVRDVTIRKIPRVPDCMPLYDILNEFQKGHSHMAVVVKRRKDVDAAAEYAKKGHCVSERKMKANTEGIQAEENGRSSCHITPCKHLDVITDASSAYSSISEKPVPFFGDDMEQGKLLSPQLKKWEGRDKDILNVDLDFLPGHQLDEVVGIITMEDVIEELLQEEILDETDLFVDVHSKVSINMLPVRRSSPNFAVAASVSRCHHRTPGTSPLSVTSSLSSYHHTPILHSPVSPYIQPQCQMPTLSSSPRNRLPNTPTGFTGLVCSPPVPHQVSGMEV